MRVLVVGGGAREHALCWKLKQSPDCSALLCAPGNAGIAAVAECHPVAADDVEGLLALCQRESVDFVVVGPEGPLVLGLVDRLEAAGIAAFGPSAAAAALEGSKAFTKELCARHGIPTAAFRRFTDAGAARLYVRERGRLPIVVKADGLAAGKGVVIAQDLAEADAAIAAALEEGRFGKAGAELVIEDYLEGEEVSFFALVDGETALPLAGAQDHKRVGDGDTGPNTGGMGAYSPAPVLTPAIEAEVMERIVRPTVRAMKAEGRPFKGVLFAGLMITAEGPMLIEYNTRFGDPECEVLMPRLASDLLPALKAARDGRLAEVSLRWHDASAVTVVMAARGYPGDHVRNTEIRGVEAAGELANVLVFHAGTARDSAGALRSTGGRVLAVTSIGRLFRDAHAQAYRAVAAIDWPDGFCRRDIGWRAVKAEGGV